LSRLGGAALIIAATRAALGGTLFFVASASVDRISAASTSLQPVIVATAVAGAIGGGLDVVVTVLGFAWLSALLTAFYAEEAGTAASRDEPAVIAAPAWAAGRYVAVLIAGALIVNAGATLTTLERTALTMRPKTLCWRWNARSPPAPTWRRSTSSAPGTAWSSSTTTPT
jgi:hypothetical protein